MNLKIFNDYVPRGEVTYFSKPEQKDNLSVIVPFFNETDNELKVTLKSLHKCFKYLCKNKPEWRQKEMCIVIIQDGWFKSSPSMKEYLKKLFPVNHNGKLWWENEDFLEEKERKEYLTYIFEDDNYICIDDEDEIFLNISMIIKMDNRRKHNSHEWFMGHSGFAEAKLSKYLLCTDAFTIFRHTCLYHLVNHMDINDNVSVATGRQRVMTREQQGSIESDLSMANWLRNVQLFDFELANSIYNGAFSLGGYLPVIPGPCGLYRASDILQDSARDWYFSIVNEEPDKTGLILGNLKIAEDRILSYAAVLKTKDVKNMAFVPLALFYFEAETDLEKFLLQRRRWINGSVAGYLYILFTDSSHFFNWNVSLLRKIYVWFLLFSQFMIYFSVSISPAYTIRMLYYSFDYMLTSLGYKSDITILTTITWILFLTHLVVHSKRKYNYFIINLLLFISVVTMLFSIVAILYYILVDSNGGLMNLLNGGYVIWISLIVFFGPFFLATLLSGRGHSLFKMLKSFIPYLLFLPMLISWFGSYSFTRIWDLSWGNRPTSDLVQDSEKKDIMQKKFKNQGMRVTISLFILNIFVFFLPKYHQEILLSIFFTSVVVQMGFSFIYMINRIPDKMRFTCFNLKKWAIRSGLINDPKNIYEIEEPLEEEQLEEVQLEEVQLDIEAQIEEEPLEEVQLEEVQLEEVQLEEDPEIIKQTILKYPALAYPSFQTISLEDDIENQYRPNDVLEL